jgi:adenosylcobinamide-GDP ribazoletransferase
MRRLKQCCAAFRFLTIIPLPGTFGTDLEDLRGALPFFPVVGMVLGLMSGAAAWLAWQIFPPFVAAVIATFVLLSVSGALHLDGLADCADGFFSSRERGRILEIMRDSRIGVMGVIAVVMIILLKVSVLSGLERDDAVRAAVLMPVAGRAALVMMISLLPYVRKEGGLGSPFYAVRAGWPLLLTLVLLFGSGFAVMGMRGLVAGLVVMMVVFLFSRLCHRKIGGATGDTLGASCELAETVLPFMLLPNFFL